MNIFRALVEWMRCPGDFKRGGYIRPAQTYECRSAVLTIGGVEIQLGEKPPVTQETIDRAIEAARRAGAKCDLCGATFDLYFIIGESTMHPHPRARCGECAERWGWDIRPRQPSDHCKTLPGMGSYFTPVVDESRKGRK